MQTPRRMLSALVALTLLTAAVPAARAYEEPPAGDAFMRPMTLTDAKLRAFFDAVDELGALASDAAAGSVAPTRPEAFAQALHVSGASTAILEKHGFQDATEFQRVGYNAALAYGVLKDGGKEAVAKKMAAAEAQQAAAMAKMREQLPPEQAAMIEAQAKAGMAMARGMRDVPDENLELMKKYRDRMARLGARR